MIMPGPPAGLLWLGLALLSAGWPAAAQSQQPPVVPGAKRGPPDAQGTGESAGEPLPDPRLAGSITGTIVDPTRAAVAAAQATLSREDQSPDHVGPSHDDGQVTFSTVAPRP